MFGQTHYRTHTHNYTPQTHRTHNTYYNNRASNTAYTHTAYRAHNTPHTPHQTTVPIQRRNTHTHTSIHRNPGTRNNITPPSQPFTQPPDQETRRISKLYFKLIQATHHLGIINKAISTKTFPPGMQRQATRLTDFIRPAAPSVETTARVSENTTTWMQNNMTILRDHYTTLMSSLHNIPNNPQAFQIATGWAKKRFHNRLSPSTLHTVENNIGTQQTNPQPPLQPHDPPPPSSLLHQKHTRIEEEKNLSPQAQPTTPPSRLSFPQQPKPRREIRLPSIPETPEEEFPDLPPAEAPDQLSQFLSKRNSPTEEPTTQNHHSPHMNSPTPHPLPPPQPDHSFTGKPLPCSPQEDGEHSYTAKHLWSPLATSSTQEETRPSPHTHPDHTHTHTTIHTPLHVKPSAIHQTHVKPFDVH